MAVHMRNGIQYGGIPNGTVKGVNPSTVPTTVKQLNQIGTVGNIAPVTIPSAVKFSNGNTLETAIGSVATIETSPTVATHEVGEFIFYNGQLYEVTAAVAAGETFVEGTNIEAKSIGDQLTALNNGLIVQFPSTGWTTTETVNNTTYYTQTVSVTSVSGKPIIGITPISGTLPTGAEQSAFDSVSYFTANDTNNTIKAYATSAPANTFAVAVKGAR